MVAGLCLLATFLCGCVGYQLGPTNGSIAGGRSIQINPFRNETLEPRLSGPVATALRRNFQQDGTYRLATREGGDIILNGTLARFDREGLSFERRDVVTARDFSVMVVAKVTAIERASGKTVLDREVIGRTTLRTGVDLASAERQAIPLLADDLARHITSLLVDGDW